MLKRIFIFARTTATEVMRQPTFFLILMFGMVLIILSPMFSFFTLLQSKRLIQDAGLSTMLLTGLFIGVFSASGVIYRELKGRTAATILSKRAGRGEFVIGKFFGIAATITIAVLLMSFVLSIIVRHGGKIAEYEQSDQPVSVFLAIAFLASFLYGFVANYFFSRNFCASTVKAMLWFITGAFLLLCLVSPEWKIESFGKYMPWQISAASVLLLFGIFILSTWAIAVSIRFHLPVALLITSGVFLLGLMSDHIFGQAAGRSLFARIAYSLLPNIQFFWVGDAVGEGIAIPASYILMACCYAVLYMAAMLSVGVLLLETREID